MRNKMIPLSRGGLVVRTSEGPIQFGIPPETIKDTMRLDTGVPVFFVVPDYMFDIIKGIAFADLEFPLYYNFFIKRIRTRVLCTGAQRKRLRIVLNEALFGPEKLNLEDEFVHGKKDPWFPDLKKEMRFFRREPLQGKRLLQLIDLVDLITFDNDGNFQYGNVTIRKKSVGGFELLDGDSQMQIPRGIQIPVYSSPDELSKPMFRPPHFGITILGTGHGFNPDTSTSGMLLWLNRSGIMVDPPVNSSEKLIQLGVNPKLIDNIILTHCHSDHDAGTLQKILQEGKINLYSTRTIFRAFIRKSAALVGVHEKHLRKLVRFYPVRIQEPIVISGGEFRFSYNLHSIPTISFQVRLKEKSMIYTSDHLNDPGILEDLHHEGIISEKRRNLLLAFPWDHTVIFHEAGIPPLHTPIEFLISLPDDVRKRTYLLHTDVEKIPPDSGLRIAPEGLSNTIELDVSSLPHEEAVEILDVLSHVNIFRELSIEKARELLILVQRVPFKAGEYIHRVGDPTDFFNIILYGTIEVTAENKTVTRLSNSDFFGEKGIILGHNHSASAQALTDCILLRISAPDFLSFIRGTEIESVLKHLASVQSLELREVLSRNFVYRHLTPTQKINFHSMIRQEVRRLPAGETVADTEHRMRFCYIIKEGEILAENHKKTMILQTGDLVGAQALFHPRGRPCFEYFTKTPCVLYPVRRTVFTDFLSRNPGVYIKLFHYYSLIAKIEPDRRNQRN